MMRVTAVVMVDDGEEIKIRICKPDMENSFVINKNNYTTIWYILYYIWWWWWWLYADDDDDNDDYDDNNEDGYEKL